MQCFLEHVSAARMSPQQDNYACSVKLACNEEFTLGPMIRHSSTTVVLANLTSLADTLDLRKLCACMLKLHLVATIIGTPVACLVIVETIGRGVYLILRSLLNL